ncbi:hypothetical protein [Mucilaginibacter polytrichastri]|uniref:Uncharacterized protein n=1 Tax=Mucilaginibacter polytrichastri TaxID=1302689 RepID=A0A1Q5ZXY1_9SPHI|nr:hypothetical protein [Mucilaginibacter polytrichastri]OKS86634.1 hypothetical protein RG47T_2090 [Mucilaginibacter polytrichastri]SFS81330.1 hypothetical protein SAMN04487890_104201 [Mucilaginibacter polytrichastri]
MKRGLKGLSRILTYTILLFAVTNSFAQTVSITNVDPGPYGPGSSIAVKIATPYGANCLKKTNIFNLFLSDASGDFTNETPIGIFNGYGSTNGGLYATFVNGTIPTSAQIIQGVAYRVRVKTTAPAYVSAPSAAFSIGASPGVQASITSTTTMSGYPEVFGKCIVSANLKDNYTFLNNSTAGTVVTANFYDEQSLKDKGTIPFTGTNINFTADTSNKDAGEKFRFGISHDAQTSRLNYTNTSGTTEGSLDYETTLPSHTDPYRKFQDARRCYDFY